MRKEPMWWVPPGIIDEVGDRQPSTEPLEYALCVPLPVKGSSPNDGGLIITTRMELWMRPDPKWSARAEAVGSDASVAFRSADWQVEGVGWYKGKALQVIMEKVAG